ncbi:YggS family pyridoxal phosphate-dependent enzyme [Streptococcus sp. S784/96/1]|uniref:YggS family pyridoxal phosphate-dependent enzyme n=1 Tax=Streptococcus sp. S784/96/1 TaxID=2653499 RepID=UPI001387438D|nr:YggS family pyridoxal phosphate-dependent enzyme [Streptococcus sp. S784/96/1]
MTIKSQTDKVFGVVNHACHKIGRSPESVSVIAVTKYVDHKVASQLVEAGVRHIGENRVDQFLEKYEALKANDNELTWHLIGSLQRRKVKDVINLVDYFHALDSIKLAQEIQKRAQHKIKCFLQVNISGETTKHGFSIEELEDALPELEQCDHIEIVGLMTMAPFGANETTLVNIFRQTKLLQETLRDRRIKNMPMTELSMGMSSDYQLAIQEGATFVRIGTAFFN